MQVSAAQRDGGPRPETADYAPRHGWGVGTVERYDAYDQIGEGTYGKVFKARDKVTGDLVALKKMNKHHESEGVRTAAGQQRTTGPVPRGREGSPTTALSRSHDLTSALSHLNTALAA
jgi:serine/threonine protein kinase